MELREKLLLAAKAAFYWDINKNVKSNIGNENRTNPPYDDYRKSGKLKLELIDWGYNKDIIQVIINEFEDDHPLKELTIHSIDDVWKISIKGKILGFQDFYGYFDVTNKNEETSLWSLDKERKISAPPGIAKALDCILREVIRDPDGGGYFLSTEMMHEIWAIEAREEQKYSDKKHPKPNLS